MGGAIERLDRTGWLALVVLAVLGAGVAATARWPSQRPALDCPPEDIRWEAGIARCAPGSPAGPVPTGPGLTAGIKLDLNRASRDELSLLPGIGPGLAAALIDARRARGRFGTWEEVDEVPGIGPAKLEVLKASAELR